jgi:uncharacterized coiled-coil DUF342 family protein
MLKELQKKKSEMKDISEESKEKRNVLNTEASAFATKRNELNKRTKDLINEAQELKILRDEINEKVSEYKNKRDDTNAKANELFAEADSIRKQNNLAGPSIKALRKDIDRLEFTQQTEVLSTSKERELVGKITQLQKQYQVKKVQLEENLELKIILDEAQQIRDEASKFHTELAEYARQAQEHHEKMIAAFKEADRIRAESDIAHREFVKAQEAADEQHKIFINAQKEIRELDKEIFKLKKKDKDGKSRVVKSELQKDAKSIFEKFKGGAKLTTEDLMTLQRSGLV